MTHRSSDGVLYNANTADVVEIIPGRVRGGHFSDDGSILLVWWSNLDDRLKNTAKIYNAETGQEQAVFLGHAKRVLGGRITPDSTRALTWSLGGDLQLWDASDGSLVHAFQGHRQSVKGVVFAPNGERFLTWSSDGTIRLWDLENGEELGILYQTGAESGILSAPVFSEDGRYITVRADGVVSKI
ncbi:WD40 repeat domain-containing protein [Shimia sp. MMG029]|uniref:WD40 repeat domain-containing protein n=1 Tax=Shimia sp. MMG029 TaxID=3021978 RepID=UPI0022FE3295|nr:hypothetical protein [Shimia sp. MMG029]MDA5556452.1 hypothetical protein [Shimia sp. MMG029]